MNRLIIVFALLACCPTLFSYEVHSLRRCQGLGDGGFPHAQMYTPEFQNILKTQSLAKDFLVWENTNRVIYRSEMNDLKIHDLKSSEESTISENVGSGLSRIVDEEERYLLTQCGNYVKDTWANAGWTRIPFPGRVDRHVFWHERKLYSVVKATPENGNGLGIYTYDAEKNRVKSCYLNSKLGDDLQIAEGHSYPYIYLYKQTKLEAGYDLETFRVNTASGPLGKKCALEKIQSYADPIPGKVLSLSHYPAIGGNVIQIDHPTKNLLWDRGADECTFYNVEGRSVYPLSSNTPYVATWNSTEGLGILNAQSSKAVVLKNVGKFPVLGKNLWLTKNAKSLFVAQQPEAESINDRIIFRFEMDNLPTD